MGLKVKRHQNDPRYIYFFCPGCLREHTVPTRDADNAWEYNENDSCPTLDPSILLNKGRANQDQPICHSFVKDGKIRFLPDCTHALAGKVVDLIDMD